MSSSVAISIQTRQHSSVIFHHNHIDFHRNHLDDIMFSFALLVVVRIFAALVSPPCDIIPANRIADIHPEDLFSTAFYKPAWISPPTVTPVTPITPFNASIILQIGIRRHEPIKITTAVPVDYSCRNITSITPLDLSNAMRIVPDPLLPVVQNEPCTCCTTFTGEDAQIVCSGSTCATLLEHIRTSLDDVEPAPPRPDFMASRRVPRSKWQKFVRWVKFTLRRKAVQAIRDSYAFLLSHYGIIIKRILLLIWGIKVFHEMAATMSIIRSRWSTWNLKDDMFGYHRSIPKKAKKCQHKNQAVYKMICFCFYSSLFVLLSLSIHYCPHRWLFNESTLPSLPFFFLFAFVRVGGSLLLLKGLITIFDELTLQFLS